MILLPQPHWLKIVPRHEVVCLFIVEAKKKLQWATVIVEPCCDLKLWGDWLIARTLLV